MSKIEVNEIDKQSGSTLTIGGSGTTVQLGTGATQTGFGATGGISWQTSIKTTDFTAASGEGYFVNTSGGSNITVTLPASPSAGNVVAIKDYARTFGTNKVIMARNGSNMDGATQNTDLETDGLSVTFVFMDSTKGWSLINDDITSQLGAKFISATGGTVTTVCTNFKVHTFTGPGTFCVSCAGNSAGSNTVSYLVVAGGAGGGAGGNAAGAGGGAGGFREGRTTTCSYTASPLNAPAGLPVTATGFPITVGGGGAGATNPGGGNTGGAGNPSTFSTVTSAGGGGGWGGPGNNGVGGSGGSGGGSVGLIGYPSPTAKHPGGAGNTPSVSPPQGNPGGEGNDGHVAFTAGAGGGGAGAAGTPFTPTAFPTPGVPAGGLTGGAGVTTEINASSVTYAGGGGGAWNGDTYRGVGGSGGGGDGLSNNPGPSYAGQSAGSGTDNTGGGGGAITRCAPGTTNAGAGGSGIVIIRYKFQ